MAKRRKPKTTAPTQKQIETIKGWLFEGLKQHEIEAGISEAFPAADKTALIAATANSLIDDAGTIDADLMRGFALGAYQSVYRAAIETGQWSAAISAVDRLLKLARDNA